MSSSKYLELYQSEIWLLLLKTLEPTISRRFCLLKNFEKVFEITVRQARQASGGGHPREKCIPKWTVGQRKVRKRAGSWPKYNPFISSQWWWQQQVPACSSSSPERSNFATVGPLKSKEPICILCLRYRLSPKPTYQRKVDTFKIWERREILCWYTNAIRMQWRHNQEQRT